MAWRMDDEPTDPGGELEPRRIVVDRISECYRPGGAPLLSRARIEHVVVHHCSLSHETPDNPAPVSDAVLDAPMMAARMAVVTGVGRQPYHVVVRTNGVVEQALPLDRRGAHAIGHNRSSLALCVIGEDAAPLLQLRAAIEACRLLVIWSGCTSIVGHCDLPGASADPRKRCPWPTINVPAFRGRVVGGLPSGWDLWTQAQRDDYCVGRGLVVP